MPLSILPIDIYGGNENTTTFDVARGIYEALNRHANIINLSLGGQSDSELIRSLVLEGSKKGVLFFAAAGNYSSSDRYYPAACDRVVAVSATDESDSLAGLEREAHVAKRPPLASSRRPVCCRPGGSGGPTRAPDRGRCGRLRISPARRSGPRSSRRAFPSRASLR